MKFIASALLAATFLATPALAFETSPVGLASTWAASNFALPNTAIDYRPLALQTTYLSLGGNAQDPQLARSQRLTRQTASIHLDTRGWQTAAIDNELHLRAPKALKLNVQAYASGGLSLNRIDAAIAPGLHYGGGLAIAASPKLNFKLGYTSSVLDLAGNAGSAAPVRQLNASLAYRF